MVGVRQRRSGVLHDATSRLPSIGEGAKPHARNLPWRQSLPAQCRKCFSQGDGERRAKSQSATASNVAYDGDPRSARHRSERCELSQYSRYYREPPDGRSLPEIHPLMSAVIARYPLDRTWLSEADRYDAAFSGCDRQYWTAVVVGMATDQIDACGG